MRTIVGAALTLALVGSAQAQERVAGALGALVGVAAGPAKPSAPTPASEPGYLGVTVEPGTRDNARGAVILSVEPGSPAAQAGLQPGDFIFQVMPGKVAFMPKPVLLTDQASVEAWERATGAGVKQSIYYGRGSGRGMRGVLVTLAAPPSGGPRGPSGAAIDDARTAYMQMCARGQERLSATTCEAMRRDLEQAMANQAAAKREAEVMGVYRQLCSPGHEKLSKETCAGMLAEAKQALAAPTRAPVATTTPKSAPPPAPAKKAAAPNPSGQTRSAYDELCKPGKQQVSAETCAALKADAAR